MIDRLERSKKRDEVAPQSRAAVVGAPADEGESPGSMLRGMAYGTLFSLVAWSASALLTVILLEGL